MIDDTIDVETIETIDNNAVPDNAVPITAQEIAVIADQEIAAIADHACPKMIWNYGRHDRYLRMGNFLSRSEGLGAILAELGLIVTDVELKREFEQRQIETGIPLTKRCITTGQRVELNFKSFLHPDAILTIGVPDRNAEFISGDGGIVLHLDHNASTRQAAEEVVPMILQMMEDRGIFGNGATGKHGSPGEYSRQAMMFAMLVMQMLMAAIR